MCYYLAHAELPDDRRAVRLRAQPLDREPRARDVLDAVPLVHHRDLEAVPEPGNVLDPGEIVRHGATK